MPPRATKLALLPPLALLNAAHAAPILTQSQGFTWSTITHAGNRAPLPSEMYFEPWFDRGAVNHEYNITTTEVTASQWLEFARAYAPYIGADATSPEFTGGMINYSSQTPQGVPVFSLNPQFNNVPISVGWRYAARFCNWLHNGKPLTRDAFENGAYDASTFAIIAPGGILGDQREHHPWAEYWLPTIDEWVKATYYDPDRYGPGQEGYWWQPGSQSEPLTIGAPGTPGAQTSAGLLENFWPIDVGAYPDVLSPWGLLDTSGGASEWFEAAWTNHLGELEGRYYKRSEAGSPIPDYYDALEINLGTRVPNTLNGFRIASIPTPSALTLLPLFAASNARRRRNQRA